MFSDIISKIRKKKEEVTQKFKPVTQAVQQVRNDFQFNPRPGGFVGFTGPTAQFIKSPIMRKVGQDTVKPFKKAIDWQINASKNDYSPSGIAGRMVAGATNEAFIKPAINSARNFRDFMDPKKTPVALSKQGMTSYFKGLGNASIPMINAIAGPGTSAKYLAGSAGLSAGTNVFFGDKSKPLQTRLEQGVSQGLAHAPTLRFIGLGTNPAINNTVGFLGKTPIAKKVLGKIAPTDKGKAITRFLSDRTATGALNIPEGMLMQKAIAPDSKYSKEDAGLDFLMGALGGRQVMGKGMAKGANKTIDPRTLEELDGLRDYLNRAIKSKDGKAVDAVLKDIDRIAERYLDKKEIDLIVSKSHDKSTTVYARNLMDAIANKVGEYNSRYGGYQLGFTKSMKDGDVPSQQPNQKLVNVQNPDGTLRQVPEAQVKPRDVVVETLDIQPPKKKVKAPVLNQSAQIPTDYSDPDVLNSVLYRSHFGVEPPIKPPTPPQQPDALGKERKLITSAKEAQSLPQEVKQQLQGTYEPIGNPQTAKEAIDYITTKGESFVTNQIARGDYNVTDARVVHTAGQILIKKYSKEGRVDDAVRLTEDLARRATEQGQGTQVFAMLDKLSPEGMLVYAKRQMEQAEGKKTFIDKVFKKEPLKVDEELATLIQKNMSLAQQLPDGDPQKKQLIREVLEAINKKIPATAGELIEAFRYQNMLSSPRTQLRNTHGNVFNAFITRPATIFTEAMGDLIVATLKGKERTRYLSEVPAYIKGSLSGIQNASAMAMKAWNGDLGITNPDMDIRELRMKALPKGLTVVSRFMEAQDQFLRALVSGGELARLRKLGIEGEDAVNRANATAMELLLRKPLDTTWNASKQGVLNASLDQLAKGVNALGKEFFPIRLFVPFVSTTTNLAKMSVDYSPAGFVNLIGKGDKAEGVAKAMMGSTAMLYGATLAMQGQTTWRAPADKKEKELFYAEGKKPFSVRIGDAWVPMIYFGPFALSLAIPAAYKFANEDDPKALTTSDVDKAIQTALGGYEFFSQQTFLQGIGNFANAFSGDVDYTTQGALAFTASQAIPLSGMMRYISSVVDPTMRKKTSSSFLDAIWNELQTTIPGMSHNLPAHVDPMGNPAQRNITDYIAPYGIGSQDDTYTPLRETRSAELKQNAVLNKEKRDFENMLEQQKSGGSNVVTGDIGMYGRYYKFDEYLGENTRTGLEKHTFEKDKVNMARKIFGNEEIPDEIKNQAYEKMGIKREDVEYDHFAHADSIAKAGFIIESMQGKGYNDVLQYLYDGRRESISGYQVANNKTLDLLVDEGVISEADAKALKKVKLTSVNGNNIKVSSGKSGKAKAVKKIPIAKGFKPNVTKIDVASAVRPVKIQMGSSKRRSVPSARNIQKRIKLLQKISKPVTINKGR
jgi:hypothetical protein